MTSRKEIHFHIGFHKTGSSSIQVSLKENSGVLKSNDVLYPLFVFEDECIENHSIPFYSIFSKHRYAYRENIRRGLSSADLVNRQNQKYIDQLIKQVAESDCKTIVFSGEDLSMLALDEVVEMKSFFNANLPEYRFKVFAFVRSPIEFWASDCQENIKAGLSLSESLQQIKPSIGKRFHRALVNYEKVFGKENLKVCKFEDARSSKNGLFDYFIKSIGLDISGELNELVENTGFSYEACCIASKINAHMPSHLRHGKLFYSNMQLLSRIGASKFHFPMELNESIQEWSRDELQYLEEHHDIKYSFKQVNLKINDWVCVGEDELLELYYLMNVEFQSLYVNALRDLAMENELDNKLALKLMGVANQLRPKGPVIMKKFLEYQRIENLIS
jgi:hypothetical protein